MSAVPPVGERFPDDVIVLLHNANITVTCVPIQLDNAQLPGSQPPESQWQAAIFFILPAKAPCLTNGRLLGGPYTVELDVDLHEHEKGTLIEVGIEIVTPIEPSRGTLLFITGHSPSHFETIKLISEQSELPLFIGDEYCRVLYKQMIPISDAMRKGFAGLLNEAVGRDALIRLTGHYDPDKVFADVLASLNLSNDKPH